MIALPPSSTVFPYTTLFRSDEVRVPVRRDAAIQQADDVRVTEGGENLPLGPEAMRRPGVADRRRDHLDRDLLRKRAIGALRTDRKSTRLNSSHLGISYAVFC